MKARDFPSLLISLRMIISFSKSRSFSVKKDSKKNSASKTTQAPAPATEEKKKEEITK
jgi:hypothetical protein